MRALAQALRSLALLSYSTLEEYGAGIYFKVEHIRECNGCALSKQLKIVFPSNEQKAREILELIHSNVCEPMYSSSLTSSLYYVSLIVKSYRKTWLY